MSVNSIARRVLFPYEERIAQKRREAEEKSREMKKQLIRIEGTKTATESARFLVCPKCRGNHVVDVDINGKCGVKCKRCGTQTVKVYPRYQDARAAFIVGGNNVANGKGDL